PTPEPTPWVWPEGDPEEQGVDPDMLSKLHADWEPSPVRSAVVVRHGVMVDEYYKEGYDAESVFTLQSCSKSVTGALVGIAIEQGYIAGVDVPVSDYFPHLLDNRSSYAKDITIWHLLTHSSGFYGVDNERCGEWRGSDNWVDYILEQSIVSKPGSTFNYSTGNSHLLGVIVELATGKSLYEYGKEVLFDPLEMDSVECGLDPQGYCDGGNGFAMSVHDMAKLGQLFLQGGVWEGEQIVPAQWAEDSTTLRMKRGSSGADYGYQWWVRTFGAERYPAYFAQGHFGQFIFVVPDLELVVAITSYNTGGNGMYWQFISDIIAGCSLE
ncbi:MAG: beta-lactamase family protein, partial [Oscillospiraceae bacterium]|nr:beta-lactamase family protein [Oscillospiraceae bacterium]